MNGSTKNNLMKIYYVAAIRGNGIGKGRTRQRGDPPCANPARTARADTRSSKRGEHVLFVDALLCGHQPQNAIEGADSQGKVIWNREALRERFICLQDDMTTLLMDLAIVPMFAERLNDRAAREVARDFHVVRTSSRTRRRRMRTASFSG